MSRTRIILDGVGDAGMAVAESLLPDSRYEIVLALGTRNQVGEDLGWLLGYGTIGHRVLNRVGPRACDADVCVTAAHADVADGMARARWALEGSMDVLILLRGRSESWGQREISDLRESATAASHTAGFMRFAADDSVRTRRLELRLQHAILAIRSAPPGVLADRIIDSVS